MCLCVYAARRVSVNIEVEAVMKKRSNNSPGDNDIIIMTFRLPVTDFLLSFSPCSFFRTHTVSLLVACSASSSHDQKQRESKSSVMTTGDKQKAFLLHTLVSVSFVLTLFLVFFFFQSIVPHSSFSP